MIHQVLKTMKINLFKLENMKRLKLGNTQYQIIASIKMMINLVKDYNNTNPVIDIIIWSLILMKKCLSTLLYLQKVKISSKSNYRLNIFITNSRKVTRNLMNL
jgi:hypothetical protein